MDDEIHIETLPRKGKESQYPNCYCTSKNVHRQVGGRPDRLNVDQVLQQDSHRRQPPLIGHGAPLFQDDLEGSLVGLVSRRLLDYPVEALI